MEESLLEAAKQAPALMVLVFIVVHFVRYLDRIHDAHAKRIAKIAEENRQHLEKQGEIMERALATIAKFEERIKK